MSEQRNRDSITWLIVRLKNILFHEIVDLFLSEDRKRRKNDVNLNWIERKSDNRIS
jgi:hypothetical protein